MQLVVILMNKLQITEKQAKGGSGLLFKMAKEQLGADDFGKAAGKRRLRRSQS